MVIHFFQLGQFHLFMERTCPLNFKEANVRACVCVCVCVCVCKRNHEYKMSHPGANPQVLYAVWRTQEINNMRTELQYKKITI